METKKHTTHSSFWWAIALFFLWAISVSFTIIFKSHVALIIVFSLNLVAHLVSAIQCRIAWHSYLEITDEGIKMKGCAKRITSKKKEKVDDLFIPWEDVEEINGSIDGPVLVLKTDEKIKLTQQIDVDSRTLQKAFEQYLKKSPNNYKNEAEQLKDKIVSVISEADNNEVNLQSSPASNPAN